MDDQTLAWEAWVAALEAALESDVDFQEFARLPEAQRDRIRRMFDAWWKERRQ